MKKKLILSISLSVVALLLVAAILVVIFAGNGIKKHDPIDPATYASESDDSWNKVTDGEVVIENANYKLVMDAASTHFTVIDKVNNNEYYSVSDQLPADLIDEEQAPYLSELKIGYYDRSSEASTVISYMNSAKNSVGFHFSEVKTNGNAIRVYYPLRQSEFKSFAPEAIPKEIFEEQILPNLKKSEQMQMKIFYGLYYSDYSDYPDATKDEINAAEDYKAQYPALEEYDLYIMKDTVSTADLTTITKRLNSAGYTEEQYLLDAEEYGIDAETSGKTVGFIVPVEYKLTENGFTASVLSDKIVIESDAFVLSEVELLPNFAATDLIQGASYLVPDGSGGIILHDEKQGLGFEKRIYGTDSTVVQDRNIQLAQNGVMPIFGYDMGDKGFFAVIDSAAEVSTVHSAIYGGSNIKSHIYASFTYASVDASSLGSSMGMTQLNLYPEDILKTTATVNYYLLGKDNSDYSSMAALYRQHLIENGTLGDKLEKQDNTPFYLDFTGYFTTQDSFIGITYTKNNVISTISNIEKAIDELKALGVTSINVRLKAYGNGGMNPSINDTFDLDEDVGTVEQLLALRDLVNENGGILYLEDNVAKIYKNSLLDGFDRQRHASRTLADLAATAGNFNIVTRNTKNIYYPYYSISPFYFLGMVDSFGTTFMEKVGDAKGFGFSWGDYGTRLWSDFNDASLSDRTTTAALGGEAVEKAKETFSSTMTDFGNMYSLKQNDVILNVSTTDSLLDTISYSVPFYEMVIHGYKDYASAPFNLAADRVKNKLSSIESGALCYYSCYTEEDDIIKKIFDRSLQYPTGISGIYDDIAEDYLEINNVFKDIRTETIVKHERIADDVFCTTYEGGTKIYVNYSAHDYQLADGNTVIATNYLVID